MREIESYAKLRGQEATRLQSLEAENARLRSASGRLGHAFRLLLAGKPCRDVSETIAELEAARNTLKED